MLSKGGEGREGEGRGLKRRREGRMLWKGHSVQPLHLKRGDAGAEPRHQGQAAEGWGGLGEPCNGGDCCEGRGHCHSLRGLDAMG